MGLIKKFPEFNFGRKIQNLMIKMIFEPSLKELDKPVIDIDPVLVSSVTASPVVQNLKEKSDKPTNVPFKLPGIR